MSLQAGTVHAALPAPLRFVGLALAALLSVTAAVADDKGSPVPPPFGAPAGPPRQGEELDRLTGEIARGMRCPVCQGLSIADSPARMAVDMRAKVRDMLAAGYSREQVLAYFEGSYGEFVHLAPRPRGFNLVVWLAPAVGLLLGGCVIAYYLRRARTTSDDDGLEVYTERVRREVDS